MNTICTATSGRPLFDGRDRNHVDPVTTPTGSKGVSGFVARLAGVVLVATIAVFGDSVPAEGYVACTGTPHTSNGADNGPQNALPDNWYFDPDTASCGSSDSGYGLGKGFSNEVLFTQNNGPLGGFRIATDDDDLSIAEAYEGVDSNGNPTPGVGRRGRNRNAQAFSYCRSRLLHIDDPDLSDGNGRYRDNWDNPAYRACANPGGGARFQNSSGERYVIQLTFTGANDGITYNVIVDLVARDIDSARRDNKPWGHWVNRVIVWGGPFGAAPSGEAIKNFMIRRANVIIDNDPDLVERLETGPKAVNKANLLGLAAHGEKDNFNISLDTSMRAVGSQHADARLAATAADNPFDVWAKGKFIHVDGEAYESDVILFHVGADYRLNRNTVVGVMGQLDWTRENNISDDSEAAHDSVYFGTTQPTLLNAGPTLTKAEGLGWMAGPYSVVRLADNLILDGRVAGGMSHNTIEPFDAGYRDDFTTFRAMARAQLTGDFNTDLFGVNMAINPFVRGVYFWEKHNDIDSGTGDQIDSDSIQIARVYFGPKISTSFKTEDGYFIRPHITLTGSYDLEEAGETDGYGNDVEEENFHSRIDIGVTFLSKDGISLAGTGFYSGIGSADSTAYGGAVKLTIRFGGSRPKRSSTGAAQQAIRHVSLDDDGAG